MPRRKSASTLQELCLNVATTRFDEEEIQDELENQPSRIKNSVFETLCNKFQRTDLCLPSDIFVHAGAVSLRRLNMFDLPIRHLCWKIGKTCHNLVDLSLEKVFGDESLSISSAVKLVRSLPKLQRLSLEFREEFTDDVAAAIGNNCPAMTNLNMAGCFEITDVGLHSLIRCDKLQYLNVESTRVTANGCLFILNRLPRLKVFEHEYWPELFSELAQQSNRNSYYSIEKVPEINNEHIPILSAIFPNLRSIHLKSRPDFDHLKWSPRVTSLHMFRVTSVDVGLINRAWPMLGKLTLVHCTIANGSGGIVEAPLKNLRQLFLHCGEDLIIEQQMKALLVRCKRLEILCVGNCQIVFDDLVSKLVESNALQCLKILAFTSCHCLTSGSVIKLLGIRNPLNELYFWCCDNIGACAYDEIRRYVESKNLDLRTHLEF